MGEHPTDYLKRVRKSTCYPVVRAILRLIAGFIFLNGLVFIGAAIFADAPPGLESAFMMRWLSVLWGLICFVFGTFLHQAASVLIDMADMLADANRNKH